MRDRLEKGLIHALGAERVIRNGPNANDQRLPQTLNLGFPGLDGEALLIQLDMAGIAASLGSACASGSRPLPHLDGNARSGQLATFISSLQLRGNYFRGRDR